MSEFPGMGMGDFLIRGEEEGMDDLVDTRQAKINAIGNDINNFKREHPEIDIMDTAIDDIIEGHGIDIDSLTSAERRKIDGHLKD